MNRDEFWALVQQAREASTDNDGFLAGARNRLAPLSPEELLSFQEHFERLSEDAYRWDLWAAAYIIGGGCSDDAFTDFRSWLISMGRATYEAALSDPGALVAVDLECGEEDAFLEPFGYLAHELYESATGRELRVAPAALSPAQPAGEPWDEDSVHELYPDLAAKFAPSHSPPPSPAPPSAPGDPKRPWWRRFR